MMSIPTLVDGSRESLLEAIQAEGADMFLALSKAQAIVYFVRKTDNNGIAVGPVKIGVTRAISGLKGRMVALKSKIQCPVVCIGVERGGFSLERRLHNHFAEYHISSEWFEFMPPIQRYVNEHCIGPREHLELCALEDNYVIEWYKQLKAQAAPQVLANQEGLAYGQAGTA